MTTVGRLSYAYLNGAHECMHEIDQYMGVTHIAQIKYAHPRSFEETYRWELTSHNGFVKLASSMK